MVFRQGKKTAIPYDAKEDKPIAIFARGVYETKDEKRIAKLLELGYEAEEEKPRKGRPPKKEE